MNALDRFNKRRSRWDEGGGVVCEVDAVFRVRGRGDSTTALQPRGSTVVQGRFAYKKRDTRVREAELDERLRYKYG